MPDFVTMTSILSGVVTIMNQSLLFFEVSSGLVRDMSRSFPKAQSPKTTRNPQKTPLR